MKMLIAFIKPNKLDEVMLALHKIEGLTGASSSEVHGFGRDRSRHTQIKSRRFPWILSHTSGWKLPALTNWLRKPLR